MATENNSKPNNDKKRKQYLPHNFYEELVNGTGTTIEQAELSKKPLNKVTKFTHTDSSSSDDDDNDEDSDDDRHEDESNVRTKEEENKPAIATGIVVNNENLIKEESGNQKEDDISSEKEAQENKEKTDSQEVEAVEPPAKKQCTENDAFECRNGIYNKVEIGLLKMSLQNWEIGARGASAILTQVVMVLSLCKCAKEMEIPAQKVQHMMMSLASTRKHVSRFFLRVLPIEITCYASDEEIRRAIKPVIEQFFPVEAQNPFDFTLIFFAVLYDARANTGVDRTKIIDAVTKSVPSAHKVDLSDPDVSIVVQIVKTICLIGIVEKYKELAKYNVRELTSSSK